MKIEFDSEELKPLRDRLARSIRDSIISGKLKPNEKLSEIELSKTLGVSRTPIREAFFQLETEGFLSVNPRRGAVVSALSPKDAEDIYIIKGTLEALAAKLSLPYLDAEKISELELLNYKIKEALRNRNRDNRYFLELNGKFHKILYEHCGNGKLIKLIKSFRNQTLRYNYIYLSKSSHQEESALEHQKIIDAIKIHNPKMVENEVIRHAESARKALHQYIENKK